MFLLQKKFFQKKEAIERQAILVIEWPELIEPVIDNFWKIKCTQKIMEETMK